MIFKWLELGSEEIDKVLVNNRKHSDCRLMRDIYMGLSSVNFDNVEK